MLDSIWNFSKGHHACHDDHVSYEKNELIYSSGDKGVAWQVLSGVVRLDRMMNDGHRFSGLAFPGDVIGFETTLMGYFGDEAHALTPSILAPWVQAGDLKVEGELLLQLAAIERSSAEVLNLRCGAAEERMRKFFQLLQSRQPDLQRMYLPTLRNMAEILDITIETASRVLSLWRRHGWLSERHQGRAIFRLPTVRG